MLSIVIPTFNEAELLPVLLGDVRSRGALPADPEIVVADGGSTDDTVVLAERLGCRVITAERGRGRQLRAGAAAACGNVFCFLHADVRLDGPAANALAALLRAGLSDDEAWTFHLRIDSPRAVFRVIEAGANLRTRLLHLPYGDQGLIVSRTFYDRVGGFPDVPLMEDVMMARALGRAGRIRVLPAALTVSARRWERDGVARRTARNVWLLGRFLGGSTPEQLVDAYDRGSHRRGSA